MEKVIEIDGKQVPFKSSRRTGLIFKKQFGKDLNSEITRVANMESLTKKTVTIADLNDFDSIFNLLWSLAKTANQKIPDPSKWIEDFNEFPIKKTLIEVQGLFIDCLRYKKITFIKE